MADTFVWRILSSDITYGLETLVNRYRQLLRVSTSVLQQDEAFWKASRMRGQRKRKSLVWDKAVGAVLITMFGSEALE